MGNARAKYRFGNLVIQVRFFKRSGGFFLLVEGEGAAKGGAFAGGVMVPCHQNLPQPPAS